MSDIVISKKTLFLSGCLVFSLLFFIIGSFEQQAGFYILGFILLFITLGIFFKNDKCMEYIKSKLNSDKPSDSETSNLNEVIITSNSS
jgi:hypothetical protein